MSQTVDLSVIVTVHSETCVGGPTMRAADAAIEAAIEAGFSVERIIALDNATPQTTAYFTQPAFDHWAQVPLGEGDLGRARNAIINDHAQGAAIAFLDADDLFSENWLAAGMKRLRAAEAAGQRVIVHPELNWLFDGAASVYWNPEQDDPLFTPYYLYVMNYYDSLCLSPRQAHLDAPYIHRDIPAGLSFQDWQYSIESMAAGWRHATAPDTIIFKRRRDNSLVTESQGRRAIVRALAPMRIDNIARLGAVGPDSPSLKTVAPRALPKSSPFSGPTLNTLPAMRPEGEGGLSGLKQRLRAQIKGDKAPVLVSDPQVLPKTLPHYGAPFAARVARGIEAAQYRADAPIYPKIRPHFDMAYYLAAHPDLIGHEDMDPIGHYLRVGVKEGRNPHPLFSTALYRSRHPDVVQSKVNPFFHWISTGREEGRIAAPFSRFEEVAALLGVRAREAQDLWAARYCDLRNRLEYGALGAQVAKAAQFDPLVEGTWPQALQVKIPPFHSEGIVKRLAALRAAQIQALERPAKAIILVNRPRWGGARRMEGHIADALVARYGADQVLVISTDGGGDMPEGKFPKGVRHVDLQAAISVKMNANFTERTLVELLRCLAPEVVFNVNSRLMWDTMSNYGDALAASMKIVGCFLCNEQTPLGYKTGYPLRRFYRAFDQMWSVCTDSAFLADALVRDYVLPPEQAANVHVLRGPVDKQIARVSKEASEPAVTRPQIFWAGRLDPQKRVDLVFAIAALMPEADFRLWGDRVMGKNAAPLPVQPDNVTLEGSYARFDELPLGQADLWLYTSAWDGIPQTLLEVGMSTLPLVGSAVGGTPEVLRDGMGAPIAPCKDVTREAQAFVAAIKRVLAEPKKAKAQAEALREMLVQEHTTAAYAQSINAVIDGS